jgi:hypothetical protein
MEIESQTAAAILTRLAFEQNNELKSKLNNSEADERSLVQLIMPLFREVLRQMRNDLKAYDAFPSSGAPMDPER